MAWGKARGVRGQLGCLVWGVAGHGSREQICDAHYAGGKGQAQVPMGVWSPRGSAGTAVGSGRWWRPSLGPLGGGEEGPGQDSEVGAERGGHGGSALGPRMRPSSLSFLRAGDVAETQVPAWLEPGSLPLLLPSMSPSRPRGDLTDLGLCGSGGWGLSRGWGADPGTH